VSLEITWHCSVFVLCWCTGALGHLGEIEMKKFDATTIGEFTKAHSALDYFK